MSIPRRLRAPISLGVAAALVAGVAFLSAIPVFADDGAPTVTPTATPTAEPTPTATPDPTDTATPEPTAEATLAPALTGTVRGGGAPLSGILVEAHGATGGDYHATTGGDGRFSLAGLTDDTYSIAFTDPAGTSGVWEPTTVRDVAAGPTAVELGTVEMGTVEMGTVELTAYLVVTGRVTDADTGAPVAGLTVSASTSAGERSAVTDATGRYRITGIPSASTSAPLRAGGEGTPWNLNGSVVTLPVDSHDFTVTRKPTGVGSISGTVTDKDSGATIAGATVSLSLPGFRTSAVSGSDGRFSFTALPLGFYTVTVSSPSVTIGPGWQSQSIFIPLTETKPSRQRDFVLTKVPTGTGVVTGTLVDESGSPLSNFSVVIRRSDQDGSTTSVQTDPAGRFTQTGLAKGSYTLSFSSSIYQPLSAEERMISLATSDSTADYGTITLKRYQTGDGSVRGVLRDSVTGAPISGARVVVYGVTTATLNTSVLTDSQGRWSMSALPHGTYSVSISVSGYEWSSPPVLQIADSTRVDRVDTLTAVVRGSGGIGGVVRDAGTHLPLPGAALHLVRTGGGFDVNPTVSDSAGRFALTGLPSGEYQVSVTRDGYEEITIKVDVADAIASLRVALTAIPEPPAEVSGTASIRGVLTDPQGRPIDGGTIFLSSDAGTLRDSLLQTDPDGSFAFDGLPVGDVYLSAWGIPGEGSYVPYARTVTLTAGSTQTLAIRLTAGASVEGRVTLSRGINLDGNNPVVFAIPEDADPSDVTDAAYYPVNESTGAYSVDSLPAGRYYLYFTQIGASGPDAVGSGISPAYWRDSVATGSATRSGATLVSLTAGQTLTGHNVTLVAGGAIHGSVAVRVPGGIAPLAGAKSVSITVFKQTPQGWEEQFAVRGHASQWGAGQYSIVGLSAGNYRLRFDDEWSGNRTVTSVYNSGVIAVTAGTSADAGRTVLELPEPSADEQIDLSTFDDDVLAALQGEITVDPQVRAGEATTITVGTEYAGEWVSVWANSTPTALGGWRQVSANGTVTAVIPPTLSGSHRIAVQDADLQTIGWAPVTIAPASTSAGQSPVVPAPSTVSKPRTGSASPTTTTVPSSIPTATPTPTQSTQLETKSLPESPTDTAPQRASSALIGGAIILGGVVVATGIALLLILRRRPV